MKRSAETPGREVVVCRAPNGEVRVEARLEQETVWRTRRDRRRAGEPVTTAYDRGPTERAAPSGGLAEMRKRCHSREAPPRSRRARPQVGGRSETRPDRPDRRGWILFDDACGFCRRWVPFWATTLRRRGFRIAPLQSPWVRRALDLPESILLKDLRLLLSDGSSLEGAEVYRFVMRRIWWAYPFYLLSRAPLLRSVFDGSYRAFAANRYRFSKACRMPGAPPDDRPAAALPGRARREECS